jgi:hypothetical protein
MAMPRPMSRAFKGSDDFKPAAIALNYSTIVPHKARQFARLAGSMLEVIAENGVF